MKRSEKKGFTIVELVIVIAVIAILAAVLIPNLSKLVTNANETADTMLIKELNTALDLDLERHETMYDALVAVERAGFIVSRINASVAGNEILWDSVNDCFVYLKGNEIVYQANREETPVNREQKYLYWRIYESLPTEQTYSIYLNNETYNAATSVTVGFDAGRNKNVFDVNYTGTGTAQKVILRTDGQNLTVNAGKDTVNHYGATCTLTVTAVATSDCYHEHGFVGMLASFASGKLVAYRGAQYHQTKAEVENAVGTNPKDLDKATFGQHYYQEGKCIICNDGGTSTVKTGLVDGYYYGEDGNLLTGTVDGYEFSQGMLVISEILNEENVTTDSYSGIRTSNQTFDLNAVPSQYKTNNIKIRLKDISKTNYTISADGYRVLSAKVFAPASELLTKSNWTAEDVAKLVNAEARKHFTSGYNAGDYFYSYPSDVYNEAKMYLPYINLTTDFESYLKLLGYTISDATKNDCVEKYLAECETAPLSFSEYLKLKYIKNNTISEIINTNGKYTFKCAGVEAYIYDVNNRTASTSIDVGNGYKNSPAFGVELTSDGDFALAQVGYMNGDSNISYIRIVMDSNGTWSFSSEDISNGFNWDTNTTDGSGKNYTNSKHIELHSVIKNQDDSVYYYIGRKLVIEITDNNTLKAWFVKKDNANSSEVIEEIGEYVLNPKSGEKTLDDISDVKKLGVADFSCDALELINNAFHTGAGNKHTTFVYCESDIIEIYFKMLIRCSGVTIGEKTLFYNSTGEIDLTSEMADLQGTLEAYFPASQGSDLVYPDAEIIITNE